MSAAAATAVHNEATGSIVSEQDEAKWRPFLDLPCQLTVDVAFPKCKLKDFLRLGSGSVLPTTWGVTRDVPLRINGVLIGWGELEAVNGSLCVRMTELA